MRSGTTVAAHRLLEAARCGAVFLGLSQAALAQDAPRLCVVAADADTGAVHAMDDAPGGMLIGAEKGLFLARKQADKVAVAPAGNGDTGRVLAIHAFPGGALIGAWNGVFVARQAGGTISVVDVIDADTGRVEHFRDLPGAGVLIGTENGLFLAHETGGKVTVTRAGDIGRVVQPMVDFPGGGVLIRSEKGWLLARAESGNVPLVPVVAVAPVTANTIAPVRSMRSFPGGVLIEGQVWFLAREQDGKVTVALAGDADTGVVDAIADLPAGALLVHTQQKGWFLGRAEGGKLAVTPAGAADTGSLLQMQRLGSAVLILASFGQAFPYTNGWFLAREQNGKVVFARASEAADTGLVFQMRDFAGGLLISAEKGLFLAREQDGKVTITPVGAGTGPAHAAGIHPLPGGGMLIGTTWRRWFVARAEADATVTLTPAGNADPGRVALMRDFAGGVLIGAERGVFVAGPAGDGCAGR